MDFIEVKTEIFNYFDVTMVSIDSYKKANLGSLDAACYSELGCFVRYIFATNE